jgi:hypothetical protein
MTCFKPCCVDMRVCTYVCMHMYLTCTHASQVGYSPEWTQILQNMVILNPEGAVHLAQMLVNQEGGAKIDLEAVADLFLQVRILTDAHRCICSQMHMAVLFWVT